eukprot:m.887339 g.887339  ORF g.887339 m.887339 type:complete len:96 (-) comp23636_c0_seq6:1012-1299(-)
MSTAMTDVLEPYSNGSKLRIIFVHNILPVYFHDNSSYFGVPIDLTTTIAMLTTEYKNKFAVWVQYAHHITNYFVQKPSCNYGGRCTHNSCQNAGL